MDLSPSEPLVNLEQAPAPPVREPFWDYVDLLLVFGLGFAFLVVFCFPLVMFVKSRADFDKHMILLAAILQAGLYAAVYLSIKAAFVFRHQQKSVFRSLGWRRARFSLPAAAASGVVLAFAVLGLAALLHTPEVDSPLEQFTKSPGALIFIAVLAVTGAPIFEELFFRGLLQPLLSRTFGVLAGILLTALVFGSLHLSEYGMVWQYGVLITVVGVALGYVRERSGSLLPSTIMHACFNSVSVIGLLVSKYAKH